jgi:tRNA threonylcarbamoyladenosine biosynthesis protein TsaE
MKFIVKNSEETEKIARDFILELKSNTDTATIVGLYGDLGSGKTFFTQAVAKALGVEENIVSPTFVIEKIYELTEQKFSHLIHIDAYRLENSSELLHLGWNNIISDPKNLILIEWPERVADIMPKHTKIYLKHLENETSREIEILEV